MTRRCFIALFVVGFIAGITDELGDDDEDEPN